MTLSHFQRLTTKMKTELLRTWRDTWPAVQWAPHTRFVSASFRNSELLCAIRGNQAVSQRCRNKVTSSSNGLLCILKTLALWCGLSPCFCPVRHNMTLGYNIVTCILFARQRLAKHIPAEVNARNNRTSVARQRRDKHASSTIHAVFPLEPVPMGYKWTQSEDAPVWRRGRIPPPWPCES
jgi:hypothetical protein